MKSTIIAAMGIAFALAGCAPDPQKIYVGVDTVRPVAPRECEAIDPPFPQLPAGDIDTDTAARHLIAIRKRDVEIERRRNVCRAWTRQHAAPAPKVVASN